jgi:hypothetical protein
MSEKLEKMTDTFWALLSQTRWKSHDKEFYLSLRAYQEKHGGITAKQLKMLNHIYFKYSK